MLEFEQPTKVWQRTSGAALKSLKMSFIKLGAEPRLVKSYITYFPWQIHPLASFKTLANIGP